MYKNKNLEIYHLSILSSASYYSNTLSRRRHNWCNMGTFATLLPFLVVSSAAFSLSEVSDVSGLVHASNKLGINIHRKLAAKEGNILVSPTGISTALAMLYYGSRGKTADEMRTVLGYKDSGLTDDQINAAFKRLMETTDEESKTMEYVLHVANAIFAQKDYPFLPEYKDGLLQIYKAAARDVDFQNDGDKAVEEINDWVKLKTNNQIEKLFDDVDPATVMILINALYLKGTWKTEFDPKDTAQEVFFNKGLQSGRTNVEMMHVVEEFPYARIEGGRLIELPYKGDVIAMIIFLPDAMRGSYESEQALTPEDCIKIMKDAKKVEVDLAMPKFKLDYEVTLNTVLQQLGLKDIFEDSANLSGMSKESGLAVSKVVHKTAIDVNEQGSEASSVTGVGIEDRFGGGDNEFIVNCPFLFAIYDKRYSSVYYEGRISEL